MRQATVVARNIGADLGRGTPKPYRHHDLGLVVDLGYHLFALPTVKRRIRVATDWVIAGKPPDDVSLRLLPETAALITNAEIDRP